MSKLVEGESVNQLPESNIQPRSKFSIIWLVPVVTIILGAWLGYRAWSEMGPEITISFATADGLEAGKTKIKYKNVEVGVVKSISLQDETNSVEVIAEMVNDAKPFLTDKTRFWVVTARVNAKGASGLETLLSGGYIGVDPDTEGKSVRKFKGLDINPVITGDIPGKHFLLKTKNLGSIEREAPIYYKKFNVGRVEAVKLDNDGQSVSVNVFVQAPYDQWINTSTKFWNASGVELSMNSTGLNVNTESLVSILMGGIAFESKEANNDSNQVEDNAVFELFSSRADSQKPNYNTSIHPSTDKEFVIFFSDSVRGLEKGAEVDFKGIVLGKVTNIKLDFNKDNKKIRIPVTISIDYKKIFFKKTKKERKQLIASRRKRIDNLIKQGMRAQLKTGNMLTGQLYVSLDFYPDAKPYTMNWDEEYPEIPSVAGALGVITNGIGSLLKKADAVMTQVEELTAKLNNNFEPQLTGTLVQAENTLLSIQGTLASDSALQQDLHTALREFTKASRSIKALTDYLEKHPESLLKGKK